MATIKSNRNKFVQLKVLLFDIETAPNIGYTWQKYEQDVISFKQEGFMLSFAYKWANENKINAFSLPDFPLWKRNKHSDSSLVKELWKLLDKADIVIGHNAKRFDIKKSNTFFLKAGLKPPSSYKVIDTCLEARKRFSFNSNKLDDLGTYLKLGRKIKHSGFDLWLGCMSNDKESWRLMVKYNKQDVVLLEKVYKKITPWIDPLPKFPLVPPKRCPRCGSKHFKKDGKDPQVGHTFQKYECLDCDKHFQGEMLA